MVFSLRSRRLEVVGTKKQRAREKETRVSPSRAPVLSFARYFQAPATQARKITSSAGKRWGGADLENCVPLEKFCNP